ncbi:MAG: hypothetical protein WAT84_02085 [Candidatus Moraniibacteriota bacterium]
MSTQILTNIGNTGTDFIASTGALTLAGVLTANGGITLAGSQSFSASALSYMDLGLITHSSTADQGLRLPNAASATPSNPTSGEGYLAWDAAGDQLITYNGSAWSPLTGSASDLQTSYNADADGSNTTITLSAADDGLIITNPTSSGNNLSAFTLQVSQLNTTAAITTLDLVQASNAANGVDLTANAIDTETALSVTANLLTSGKALTLASSSTAFTGALESITLSGSNAANTGNLLLIADTGALNTTTSFKVTANGAATQVAALIENTGSGTSFRVNDVASDTDPFLIDATGNVGIGDATPNTLLDVLSSGAADTIFTLANTNAGDYDPVMKFELTEGTPLFTLGVDDSDSDKFKIYSGDGLASGDEFIIDANGTTTIANLNLGATTFDENAGAVTWIDMSVTSAAAVDTIESYAASIDGNALLTVYAESDAAGSIQDRRVVVGTGAGDAATTTLLSLDVKTLTGNPTNAVEGAMYYNAADDKFRCYQASAWTDCIGAGGSTTLQTAYDTDGDGTNTTISLTAADDGLIITNPTSAGNNLSAFTLQVSQLNTTAAITTLDLVQASNAANGVGLTANSIDTETGLAISATGLTSGYAETIAVNAATTLTSGGALSITGPTGAAAQAAGSLLKISTAGATTGTAGSGNSFQVSSASTLGTIASITASGNMTTTGNLLTLGGGTSTTPTGLLTVNASTLTSGYAADFNVNGAAVLTSGGAINIDGPTGAAAQAAGSLLMINTTGAVTGTDGSGNSFQINSATATGTVASISSSGTMTTTGDLLTLTANNATTATGLLTIDGGSAMTSGSVFSVASGSTTYVHGAETGSLVSLAVTDSTTAAVTSTTNNLLLFPTINAASGAATRTINGVSITPAFTACTAGTCAVNGVNIANVTDGTGFTGTAVNIGTGWDVGINAGTMTIENIGNTGTDFIASTGALTLAGVLTANGGISLAGSQSFSASALSYMDLGAITHSSTANQGLRLPNAASATPSNPTSGEGYLAWDAAGNQLITYNGSSWSTLAGGSGYNLIKDESTGLTARTTLAFLGAGVTCADNATQTECTINGGTAPSDTLQNAYDAGSAGDQVVTLDATQDSIIVRNPSSSGSDSTFTFKVEQLNTGIANTALYVDNRGTGSGLRIDDESGDTTPFIIDGHGRVGIGTTTISEDSSTERLFQVGSETNRGNSVTYGEVVSKGQKDLTALTGIKDIFVYDTTSDSDGGRWIDWATTDQLSWYSESLDDGPSDPCDIASDDRCYKAAFPRKAILIVTTSALYIFDAQDNTMWMKFSQNAAGYALGVDTSNDPSSVTALNGVVYVGTNGASAGGLYAIDFVNDRMWNYDDTDRSGANVGISSRNAAVTYASDNNTNFDLGGNTGWKTINDVSAAAIQWSNTAIAATTGPVNGISFVALATDSGVNLINLAQQRLFQYSRITDDNYESVVITKSARLYALDSTRDELNMWNNVDSDVASQLNVAADKAWDEATNPALTKNTPVIGTGSPDALEVIERASLADGGLTAGTASDLIYIGHDQGLTELHDHATLASGWVKYYNTTRQTAILPAATRRAHMMDDASGDVTNQSVGTDIMVPKGSPTYGVNGVRGKAMSFNGTSQYLCSGTGTTCANDTSDNLSTGSWTISVWFKHTAGTVTGTDTLFARCHNTTPAAAAGCVAASMVSSGVMTVNVDFDATFTIGLTGTTVFHSSTQTYNDGQWHFLMVTRAATTGAINTMIDGKPIGQTNGVNTTLDASQILSIGADCSVGAACATGANFWDGSIDDFVLNANGSTGTTDNIAVAALRRVYNDARPLVNKRVVAVTNATSATTTTITDTGETWIPNEFAGQVMAITSDTGAGQTRRVVSNTTDTLTVSPAFSTTPDTTSDFEVDPEAVYGASNIVTSIGITAESPLGEARQMCIGTNSTSDTGGVTCYNHQAGPNLIADVFHSDSEQMDDSSTEWTGTDYDDIRSIDLSGRALVMGSEAHFWTETEDVRLGQGLDYLANQLFNIRQELINDAVTAQGSIGVEVGFTGGADLAERYYSNEPLQAGEVVSIDKSLSAGVKKTASRYQRDTLGIVSTEPGLILGAEAENGYPIALVGRVPVKVTNENGPIYAGDRVTAASRPGHAMLATQAGRVIGQALGDAVDWVVCEGEDPLNHDAVLCTTVTVFVNLTDYYGQPVELAMAARDAADAALEATTGDEEVGLAGDGATVRLATAAPTREEKIMTFLKEVRDERAKMNVAASEVFTDRVAASTEIITPTLIVDQIFAKSIKADSIEGLQIFTDQLSSLSEKYAGLEAAANIESTSSEASNVVKEQLAVAMKNLSVDTLTVQMDGSVLGKLSVAGALTLSGPAEFRGETLFSKLATFLGDTVFQGKAVFEKAPTFGSDTAGFAVIAEGQQSVDIAFDEEYTKQPIVSVSITSDESSLSKEAETDVDLAMDVAAVEADFAAAYFDGDIKYIVTKKSERGFTIVLNKPAPRELQFSWVAIAVAEARVSRSEETGTGEDPVDADEPPDTPPVTVPTEPAETTPPVPIVTPPPVLVTTPVVDTTLPPDQPAVTTPAT